MFELFENINTWIMNTNKMRWCKIQIKPSINWNALLAHFLMNWNSIPDNFKPEYQFHPSNSWDNKHRVNFDIEYRG